MRKCSKFSRFGFQPWHSAAEFNRALIRYLPAAQGPSILERLDITGYYGYESVYPPVYTFLREKGVDFRFDTAVKNVEIGTARGQAKVTHLAVSQNGLDMEIDVGPEGKVIAVLGSTASGPAVGTNNLPPFVFDLAII